MMHRRGARLFFNVICQISRPHRQKIDWQFWLKLSISGLTPIWIYRLWPFVWRQGGVIPLWSIIAHWFHTFGPCAWLLSMGWEGMWAWLGSQPCIALNWQTYYCDTSIMALDCFWRYLLWNYSNWWNPLWFSLNIAVHRQPTVSVYLLMLIVLFQNYFFPLAVSNRTTYISL